MDLDMAPNSLHDSTRFIGSKHVLTYKLSRKNHASFSVCVFVFSSKLPESMGAVCVPGLHMSTRATGRISTYILYVSHCLTIGRYW